MIFFWTLASSEALLGLFESSTVSSAYNTQDYCMHCILYYGTWYITTISLANSSCLLIFPELLVMHSCSYPLSELNHLGTKQFPLLASSVCVCTCTLACKDGISRKEACSIFKVSVLVVYIYEQIIPNVFNGG